MEKPIGELTLGELISRFFWGIVCLLLVSKLVQWLPSYWVKTDLGTLIGQLVVGMIVVPIIVIFVVSILSIFPRSDNCKDS